MDGLCRLHPPILGGSVASGRTIRALAPGAWYRYGRGITVATGVSQWNDQSGNGHHLTQGTAASQPAKQADGSILFDGSNDYLASSAFTDMAEPVTAYFLGRQIAWASGGRIVGGNNQANSVEFAPLYQHTGTPKVAALANLTFLDDGGDWTLNTYAVQVSVLNVASSSRQKNNGAPVTGSVGSSGFGQISVGAASNGTGPSNIQVKEVIIFAAAHNATTIAAVVRYLMAVGSL